MSAADVAPLVAKFAYVRNSPRTAARATASDEMSARSLLRSSLTSLLAPPKVVALTASAATLVCIGALARTSGLVLAASAMSSQRVWIWVSSRVVRSSAARYRGTRVLPISSYLVFEWSTGPDGAPRGHGPAPTGGRAQRSILSAPRQSGRGPDITEIVIRSGSGSGA